MSTTLPQMNHNSTIGATFIGSLVSAILYGITSLQVFVFFNGNTSDRKPFKAMIAFLWFLDCLHMIFMTHGVYHYLVLNFGNELAFLKPTWSLLAQVIVTTTSDLIVRCVFAKRIWVLSGRNTILLLSIVSLSIFVFAMGTAFAIRGFVVDSFSRLISEPWLLYTALGGSVTADGIVTVSLCVLLRQSRTGIKSTDSLLNTLMLYTVNTGLLTSICAAACFITFTFWPDEFIYIGIYFALGKLYVNSLLAVLNTRHSLRRQHAGVTTIPQSPSMINPLTMDLDFATATGGFEGSDDHPEGPSIMRPQRSKMSCHYK